MNWCDENEEELSNTNYPDDKPNNVNSINDLSFDDGFGRILLEEEPWEQEEEPWGQEEDLVDEPDPSCCAIDILKQRNNHRLESINEELIPCLLSLTNAKKLMNIKRKKKILPYKILI